MCGGATEKKGHYFLYVYLDAFCFWFPAGFYVKVAKRCMLAEGGEDENSKHSGSGKRQSKVVLYSRCYVACNQHCVWRWSWPGLQMLAVHLLYLPGCNLSAGSHCALFTTTCFKKTLKGSL